MTVDRRTLDVLLAVLQIDQRELADRMGYHPAYMTNVVNGMTKVSRPFRKAFGAAVADLILGQDRSSEDMYPAGPLVKLIESRAADAPMKRDFFADLGVNRQRLKNRDTVSGADIDRICCELGVHPSALYPEMLTIAEVS
jgi:DNA-binding Xre family transcriptional regulator